MDKQPLFVAVSNQKGGVGKSTLTVSLASYLHFVMEKNVLVVDCDYPQHSLSNLRDRDKKQVAASERLQKMMNSLYDRTGRKAYPIINSPADKGRQTADSYLEANRDSALDIILLDLPGTLNAMGVIRTIVNVDYVLMPIIPDRPFFRCTLLPPSSALLKGSNLDLLAEELCRKFQTNS
jgi:cellulose biosynthesis protein BcsQ